MKVLAIGAHFDDAELGCGGALIRHVREGDSVSVFVVTDSAFVGVSGVTVRSAPETLEEGRRAAEAMGAKLLTGGFPTNNVVYNENLVLAIRRQVEAHGYDLIYTHWTGDVHFDHRNIGAATLTAARHVPRLLMYRSNWYESDVDFRGRYYVDIGEVLEEKLGLLRFYESEYKRVGREWEAFFRNEHENAGQRIGVKAAEVFEVVKYLS